MTKLESAAKTVIHKCLDIKKDESVLIITNEPQLDIARLLFTAARKRSVNTSILELNSVLLYNELPDSVAQLMQSMNVIIAATSPSISHTDARRSACRNGARIISMPHITKQTFLRIADIDFKRMSNLSNKLKEILTFAQNVKITSPSGTDLTLSIKKRQGYADFGILDKPGAFSNLPAGEACICPDDYSTEGDLVVDSGMYVSKDEQEPLVLKIKEGKAVRIKGDIAAKRLRSQLTKYGPQSRMVAEFGIGTNQWARISGYSLEDEKVLGTIHIAIGNSVSFGGENNVPIHLDGIVYKASVEIDGKKILEKGRFLLE